MNHENNPEHTSEATEQYLVHQERQNAFDWLSRLISIQLVHVTLQQYRPAENHQRIDDV